MLVVTGIWFLDVVGSQDYNKPDQTLVELLQNQCANKKDPTLPLQIGM